MGVYEVKIHLVGGSTISGKLDFEGVRGFVDGLSKRKYKWITFKAQNPESDCTVRKSSIAAFSYERVEEAAHA